MGGQESSEFHTKLQWVETTEAGRLGSVEVFRMLETPYEYVFDFRKNYVEQNQRLQKEEAFLKRIAGFNQNTIARIHQIRVVQETQICIKAKQIHVYCNYYNFTLKQAIAMRKNAKRNFSEAELTFIFEGLLEFALYLQGERLVFGNFNSGEVYLSPQGQLKIFLLDLNQENKHTSYYRLLSNSGRLGQLILAPEQLRSLRKMEYQTKNDSSKAEAFSIAMLILEMLLVESLHIFYSVDKQEILMSKLLFALEMAEQRYSFEFIDLLRACLNPESQNRFDLQTAAKKIQSIRLKLKDPIHCLRLERKQLSEQDHLLSSQEKNKKTTYIHNSIAKKFRVDPNSALSSASTELALTKLTFASSNNRCSEINEPISN